MTRAAVITNFLQKHLGECPQEPLAGDASFRRYIRVRQENTSYMLMDAPPEREPIHPFMRVATGLKVAGFSAPAMLAHDTAQGLLLLEDLGDDTFSRLLKTDITQEETYYQAAVEVLAAWHTGAFTPSANSFALYDEAMLAAEIKLFSNWFLPQIIEGSELAEAQESYMALWKTLLHNALLETNQFVHRDYHADNLMWLPARNGLARVGLLDFQDAVMGDAAYDMVSLLEDARRDVPPDLAHAMIAHYLEKTGADKARFTHTYALLAAQRNSKIVGIFTRLAARDCKAHYLEFLPRVWAHLSRDAEHPALSSLKDWMDRYVPQEKRGIIAIAKNAAALGLAA